MDEDQLGIFYKGNEIARHKLVGKHQTSFLDSHKRQLEEGCFHMPVQKLHRRISSQVEVCEQGVEVRNLNAYEGV